MVFRRLFLIALAFVAVRVNAETPLSGEASWYGQAFKGRPMANGQPYDPEDFTCACWFYPLGTKLKVTNRATGEFVIVVVTDRGPAKPLIQRGRVVDLSLAAFSWIAHPREGLIHVRVERL
jgi:rare lipoprotein A